MLPDLTIKLAIQLLKITLIGTGVNLLGNSHRHGVKTGSACWPGGTDIAQEYRRPDYLLNYLSKSPYNNNMGYYSLPHIKIELML